MVIYKKNKLSMNVYLMLWHKYSEDIPTGQKYNF